MLKKKLLSLVLISGVILTTLVGCQNDTNSQGDSTEQGETSATTAEEIIKEEVAMWEVTSPDSEGKLYLVGTIHVGKEDTFPLREEIETAFDESDYLAVEFDLVAYEQDMTAQISLAQSMIYTDGSTISDHIGEELYTKLRSLLTGYGLYNEIFDMYTPFMWYSLLQAALLEESSLDAQFGVDRTLIEMANTQAKEILEIESAESQTEMFMSFSDELMILLLESGVEQADIYGESVDALYDIWTKGGELPEEEYGELTEEEVELIEEYNKALMTDRNILMAEAAMDYLENDYEVFYAVGFAHMVGQDNIIDMLIEEGYTVVRK